MEKGQKKKDRSWIGDVFSIVIETSSILLEIILLIPRVIIRMAKDAA